MKRSFCALLIGFACLLIGCEAQEKDSSEEYARWNQNWMGYVTEDGYYYVDNSDNGMGLVLYYFDRKTGECVPVCDKAECNHDAVDESLGLSPTCNAQINTVDEYVVYKEKIYYIDRGERQLLLRRRDTDGNNDEKVAALDALQMGGQMWFYRDYAFLMAETDVSKSFDPETGESETSVLRFFLINLKTGETKILGESTLTAAVNYAFNIYQVEDGKVYYYELENDSWYIFDTDNEEVTQQTGIPENARFGDSGEYCDIYGQYCYDIFGTVTDGQVIRRLDRETKEETVIYEGKAGSDTGYSVESEEWLFVTESNREQAKLEEFFLYNIKTGETLQIPSEFYGQDGMTIPVLGDENGLIYFVSKGDSTLERRYAKMKDIMAGNGEYVVIEP